MHRRSGLPLWSRGRRAGRPLLSAGESRIERLRHQRPLTGEQHMAIGVLTPVIPLGAAGCLGRSPRASQL
jgi:hypothetical protein